MTHPAIYAGCAILGGGALALELMQPAPAPDTTVAQITAYGVIVLGILGAIPLIFAAWTKMKEAATAATVAAANAQAAAGAATLAATLAQKNLDKTEDVAVRVNGHWKDVEDRLNKADKQNQEFLETIKDMTAAKAASDQAAAVAQTEKAATLEASRVKELADLRAAQPPIQAPAPAPPAVIPAITAAAQTIADAVPQLTSIEDTGKDTNAVVKEIEKKP